MPRSASLLLAALLLAAPLACQTPAANTPPMTDAPTADAPPAADPLAAALANPARPQEERDRDAWRHPDATLRFFGVREDSTVLELWAGRGWYTTILAPYLASKGQLYATTTAPTTSSDYLRKSTEALKARLQQTPGGDRVKLIEVDAPAQLDLGLEQQVDVVLTFRNIHNWVKGGYDKTLYEQAHKALKPGGIFGVVEHRGPEGMTRDQSATSGYMDQAQVIRDIEAVGFKLIETSEINANPKDTKDHPEGVWTLPPALRLKDQDRDKYTAIGESDRMTLKFQKL